MRVRFAPSPTGFLHLGGLRTALFNYLLAKKSATTEGKLILRIEDTDRTRLVPSSINNLLKTLRWAGIDCDEGPDKSGKFGPYIQSQRLNIYKEYSDEIIESGRAYRCFCSKERLEMVKGINGKYDGHCRNLSSSESKVKLGNNEPFIIRFKTPSEGPHELITDEVFGVLKPSKLDDVVLMKSDGFPTYHFANIIDDHLMEIDLVMRGAEWIPSTPLHGLLYEAFGWNKPRFVHLPLLINPDGSKLSKRQDSAHVSHYIDSGILPSALNNFVAFLGWTPKGTNEEVFNMEELINKFDLKGLNNSDATVNFEKLKWLNRKHLKMNSDRLGEDLKKLVQDRFNITCEDDYLKQVIKGSADRIFFIKDIIELCPYYFINPDYNNSESIDLLSKIKQKDIESALSLELFNMVKSPSLLRLIMTGCKVGPPIQETINILGDKVCQKRFETFKAWKISMLNK
jgi:glutamyl-tRNA synthetase